MPHLDLSPDFKPYYVIDDHTDPWTEPEIVFFVHGFTESTEAWHGWVPYFSRRYKVIRHDVRGFGRTGPVAEDFVFNSDVLADDLVQVITHLAGKPVHVVAGKSGGFASVRLAATRPDLVKTLTLIGVPIYPPKSEGWLEHMTQHGMRSWARKTNPVRFGTAMPVAGYDWWADMMGKTSLSTAHAYLRWATVIDPRPDFPAIKCPTLVITGTAPMGTHAETKLFKQGIPHAEMLVLPVDGYHPAGADPDISARATLEFIQRSEKS